MSGAAAIDDAPPRAATNGSAPAATPGLPPGPPLPRAAQTAVWFRRAQAMLAACRARYGHTFTLKIAYEGTWVFVTRPEDVKKVFTADPAHLHAGEANRILLPVVGPHSLLLLDEDEHMEHRKLLLPPFHGKRMQAYGESMAEIAVAEIETWPLGEPYKLRPRMQAVTLEIILRTVFGVREGARLEALRSELRRLLDMVTNPRQALFLLALGPERIREFGPFKRDIARVDRLIHEEIAAHREAGDLAEREDILSLMLQARHEDGSPMSDAELRDELVTLLVAGHETTANALAWAVERLVRHPAKLERLTDEVAAGEDGYLKAVIQETLRLRPVISLVNRSLKAPFEVGGYELPAGVKVAPCIYLVHRDPEIYPEPDRFIPERFLENPPGTYTWIPFGGGVRRCLGGAFAQFEMEVVLRELVARRTLSPTRRRDERVYRRAITETPRHDAEVLVG
ncbi:MAG TPA: cytochrome P450 [Solirubrobacterales bacterium]